MIPFARPEKADKLVIMNLSELIPAYETIPKEFKSPYHPFVKWQTKWFFTGLKPEEIPNPKPGIDKDDAFRHLNFLQRNWGLKHEHKECGVAYLASLLFENPKNIS
jgi:hypothetical protein